MILRIFVSITRAGAPLLVFVALEHITVRFAKAGVSSFGIVSGRGEVADRALLITRSVSGLSCRAAVLLPPHIDFTFPSL